MSVFRRILNNITGICVRTYFPLNGQSADSIKDVTLKGYGGFKVTGDDELMPIMLYLVAGFFTRQGEVLPDSVQKVREAMLRCINAQPKTKEAKVAFAKFFHLLSDGELLCAFISMFAALIIFDTPELITEYFNLIKEGKTLKPEVLSIMDMIVACNRELRGENVYNPETKQFAPCVSGINFSIAMDTFGFEIIGPKESKKDE